MVSFAYSMVRIMCLSTNPRTRCLLLAAFDWPSCNAKCDLGVAVIQSTTDHTHPQLPHPIVLTHCDSLVPELHRRTFRETRLIEP